MERITPVSSLLQNLSGKTVIITGGANGIGLEAVHQCHSHGANVVIADLPGSKAAAEAVIGGLDDPSRAAFFPANVSVWEDMTQLFESTVSRFGKVDVVLANAGIMESRKFFDFEVDETGRLKEDVASTRVVDVNLKGAMNALRLGVFHMEHNDPDKEGWRGSVVLISSTSGYIGGTEVISYISSKHGIIGLLRSAHQEARRRGIRVNAVAPFITPTHITGGYSEAWREDGLPLNATADVALSMIQLALDTQSQGRCHMVCGGAFREVETPMALTMASWAGDQLAGTFRKAGEFFQRIGGYPLPAQRP